MKRILCLIVITLFSITAAFAESSFSGGWMPAADPSITEEVQSIFDRGLDGLVGVAYTPVAYLGSQVVAGVNHCILAQAAAVVPDAVPSYVLIYLYEDLSGHVEIMNIADFDIEAYCEY